MKKILKRAVTLAEVVVSMSIIAVISITTISVIQKGFYQSYESVYYSEARNITDNAYEAFKYSDSIYSYNQAMMKTNYISSSVDSNNSSDIYKVKYEIENHIFVVIELVYNETGFDTFTASCTRNEREVYKFTYNKPHNLEVTYD